MTRHHCSCVAGTALCTHIVALLLQSAHYSETGTQVVPPVHSCTETEQQWHKPRTMGLKPGPVGQMTITKPSKTQMSEGGIRSTLYKALKGPLPDLSVLQVEEAYKNVDPLSRPLVCTMGMSADKPLVDSRFGPVQAGSVLSYQQPPVKTHHINHHKDAPPFPSLPLEDYRLDQSLQGCMFVLSKHDELHIKYLQVTFDTAQKIEEATREQSGVSEWHTLRKPRLTSSRLREACHVRGLSSAKHLAERILRGTAPTAAMKRGLDMEMEAAIEYAKMKNINYSPCGLVIHPDVPWLASSPGGKVFDPLEHPPFGLVEFKCPNVPNFVDCKYIRMNDGSPALKTQHAYYWQVQGQLLTSGLEWCDFVVCSHEDIFVEGSTGIQGCCHKSDRKVTGSTITCICRAF
ncbi:uncharacterized protein LOC144539475 [Centroberyx gerrardi]